MAELPFQELFDVILMHLIRAIKRGAVGGERDQWVRFLHHYATFNREAAAVVRGSPVYPAIIWYERVRCRLVRIPGVDAERGFFLEGLPRGLPLFGAPVALQLPADKCRQLQMSDVLAERLRTVLKIESVINDLPKRNTLALQLDRLPDLVPGLPLSVRLYVSRMRSVCNGVREARPSNNFAQCANAHCNRFFYAGAPAAAGSSSSEGIRDCGIHGITPAEFDESSLCMTPTLEQPTFGYWNACGSVPFYDDPVKRFCCSACCIEWRRHLDRAVPTSTAMDQEMRTAGSRAVMEKVGVNRIPWAMKLALKRNRLFAAAVNTKSSKRIQRRSTAVSRGAINHQIDCRTAMLNVDLAVLYWAFHVSASPRHTADIELPGDHFGWRKLNTHARRAETIAAMYIESNHSGVITDFLSIPRFLARVKSRAKQLF